MKNYKRIASIIAIVAMLFTLINVNVFAADAAKYTSGCSEGSTL